MYFLYFFHGSRRGSTVDIVLMLQLWAWSVRKDTSQAGVCQVDPFDFICRQAFKGGSRIESIIYTPLPEGEYMFEINMEDGYNSWDIGKVIFFSKKDAEKTLKERICNGTVL